MARIKVTEHVEAPIERVFALATDFANAPDAIEAITKVEMLTQGPVGKGTRFRETRKMFGREVTEEMEVTSFEPPSHYTLGCESGGCRYHSELRFERSGAGTDVSLTFDAVPLTLLAKVLSVVMRPMMKSMAKACAKDLADMKKLLEDQTLVV